MQTKRKFLIVSLPRCRTAWLSSFFTVGNCFCFHDLSGSSKTVENMAGAILGAPGFIVGSADSGNILVLPKLRALLGEDTQIIVIRRNVDACANSLSKVSGIPLGACVHALIEMDAKLQQLVDGDDGVMEVHFDDLADRNTVRAMWGFVAGAGQPFPEHQWRRMERLHVEVDPLILAQAALGGVEGATTNSLIDTFREPKVEHRIALLE